MSGGGSGRKRCASIGFVRRSFTRSSRQSPSRLPRPCSSRCVWLPPPCEASAPPQSKLRQISFLFTSTPQSHSHQWHRHACDDGNEGPVALPAELRGHMADGEALGEK